MRFNSPCDSHLRAGALASTASRPAFVTTRDPPLLPGRDSAEIATDLGAMESNISLQGRLDDPNQLETIWKIAIYAQRHFEAFEPNYALGVASLMQISLVASSETDQGRLGRASIPSDFFVPSNARYHLKGRHSSPRVASPLGANNGSQREG